MLTSALQNNYFQEVVTNKWDIATKRHTAKAKPASATAFQSILDILYLSFIVTNTTNVHF